MSKLPQLLTCALRIQRSQNHISSSFSMLSHNKQQSASYSRRYSSAYLHQNQWIFIIITIAAISTVCSGVRSPGQLMPVTIEAPIGGSFNLTCTVSLSATCKDAANISFKYQDNSAGTVQLFKENLKILDKTTAILTVENAVEATGTYTCKCNDIGIGISTVYVGTVPLDVTDFDCRWYNFEDIHCQFRKPHNAIITDYELRVHDKSFDCKYNQTWYTCKNNAPSDLHSNLNFSVIGNNTIGKSSKVFPMNMYAIVIPTLKFESIVEVTTNSVELQWSIPYIVMFQRTAGVLYNIAYRVKSHSSADDWTELQDPQLNVKSIGSNKFRAHLQLPYANYAYVVRIRVKANKARDNVWSEWAQRECRTKSKAPEHAPVIANGSYYISNLETEPELKLYWQEIDKHQWNATGFKYKVTEVNHTGMNLLSTTLTVNPWHVIPWPKHKASITEFYVQSVNDLGESPKSNPVTVYPRLQHLNALSLTVYENKLNWQRADNFEQLIDYTIFYCLSNTQSRTSCSGSMQYVQHVPKTATSYELDISGTYIFAIAANYKDYSTGMQWQKCSTDTTAELLKPNLIVSTVNATSLKVVWQTNVCSSIVKSFTLSYGEGLDTTAHRLSIANNDSFGTTLSKLKPFTNYSMFLTMHSVNGKEISTESIKQRTAEAAPSTPPEELTIVPAATTDASVKLRWRQPKVLNGILRSYLIEYRDLSSGLVFKRNVFLNDSGLQQLDSQITRFELTHLQSDSLYNVSLQARTVELSEPAYITVKTLIGTPNKSLDLRIPPTNTELIWSKPQNIQANRSIFYLVSLNQFKKNSTAIKQVLMQSLVWTNNCTFQTDYCPDEQFNYNLQVQAIVVANISEVYNHSKTNIRSSIDIIKDKNNPSTELCSNAIAVPSISAGDLVFVYSPNSESYTFPNICYTNTALYNVSIVFGVIIGALLLQHAIRKGLQKYRNMKNIDLVLPDGLTIKPANGVSGKFEHSYKGGGGHKAAASASIGFETPEVLRDANDCFPFSSHDNTNLLHPNAQQIISKSNGILMMDKEVDEVPATALEVMEQFALQEPEKTSANMTSTSLLSHNSAAAPPTLTNCYIKVNALSKPMLPLMTQTPLSKTMQPVLNDFQSYNGTLMEDKEVDEVPATALGQFALQEPEKTSANTTSTSLLSHNSDTSSMTSTEQEDDNYYGNYNECQDVPSKQQQQPVINANGYVPAEMLKQNFNAGGYIHPNALKMVAPMPIAMSQPAAPPTLTNCFIKVDARGKPMLPLIAQTPLSKTMQPALNDFSSLELQQKVLIPESIPTQQSAAAATITHTTSAPPLDLKLPPALAGTNDDIASMLLEQPNSVEGHILTNHNQEHSQNENYTNQNNASVNASHNNIAHNMQPNINGYVTQRQLAELGRKENECERFE